MSKKKLIDILDTSDTENVLGGKELRKEFEKECEEYTENQETRYSLWLEKKLSDAEADRKEYEGRCATLRQKAHKTIGKLMGENKELRKEVKELKELLKYVTSIGKFSFEDLSKEKVKEIEQKIEQ